MKLHVLIALLLAVSAVPAFSQSLIMFDVDTTQFTPGEIVELKGTVDTGLEGKPVAVEVKDGEGNVILIRTVTSDENGEFVLKFKVPSTAPTPVVSKSKFEKGPGIYSLPVQVTF